MPLTAGSRLGSYEIVALIGAGGMGEVYRARDTKLNRDVALKVLPEAFAQDAERLARFRREAQVLASLNHPNIAAIYGLEESPQAIAIVMELVEGPTLAERLADVGRTLSGPPGSPDLIRSGPHSRGSGLPVDDAVTIARQVAEALQAAHEKAVVHRDLKPANIAFTLTGQVKVLDFGLAKALDNTSLSAAQTNSPTLSLAATRAGVILGTAAYMSPEQAKGRAADRRSDVWAFGCVFYEMLTARRAFGGEDISDTIVAVLRDEPNWSALPADVPQSIRLLIERSLAKDRTKRIPDISTALFLMDETAWSVPEGAVGRTLSGPPGSPDLIRSGPHSRGSGLRSTRAMLWAVASVAVVTAVTMLVLWAPWRAAPPAQPMRFAIVPPAAQPLASTANDRQVVISPDGTRLVYVVGGGLTTAQQLMVRAIDRLDAEPLRGITGARSPFFSPDGKWIGFFQGVTDLKKVSVTGGPAVPLCPIAGLPRGASWRQDDTVVFATSDPTTGLISVPAGGGEPRVLTRPDTAKGEVDHLFPAVLPDGGAVLFTVTARQGIDSAQIAVLDLKTGQYKILIRGGSAAEFVEGSAASGRTGYLVYAASGTLRAVRFDPARLEVLSDPVPVAEEVAAANNGVAQFSASRTGTLAYVPGGLSAAANSVNRPLVWVDRRGREEVINMPARAYFNLRLSPDGRRLALEIRDQENDIWVWDLTRQTLDRRTFDPALDGAPIWTPDGSRIVFYSQRSGSGQGLFWLKADGTGTVDQLTTAVGRNQVATSLSPDGSKLLFKDGTGINTGSDLMVLAMDGKSKPAPLIPTTMFEETGAQVSPDGRWLAYQSNDSGQGQNQVYVVPFPDVNGGKWSVSPGGGRMPSWAPSGRELFYIDANNFLTAVTVQLAPTFTVGNPTRLFETKPPPTLVNARFYDVSPDGQRFVMTKEPAGDQNSPNATPASMIVVLNWVEELKARLPAR